MERGNKPSTKRVGKGKGRAHRASKWSHFRSNVTRSRDVNGGSFNPTMTIYRLDFRFPACPRKLCGFSRRRDVIFSYTRVQIFVHERTRCTINIEGGKEMWEGKKRDGEEGALRGRACSPGHSEP